MEELLLLRVKGKKVKKNCLSVTVCCCCFSCENEDLKVLLVKVKSIVYRCVRVCVFVFLGWFFTGW